MGGASSSVLFDTWRHAQLCGWKLAVAVTSYDFTTLSPSDFELLVRDLLAAEHGWRLEAFGHGPDGGVDLRAHVAGVKIVVQCKHYAGSRFADLRSAARRERQKMITENPGRYLYVTSQTLSRTQKDTLAADLTPHLVDPADVVTRLELNDLLARHTQVEQRHFKLWLASIGVIERIVHSGLWERSEALMEDISDRVRLYVTNPGYDRALTTLEDRHVLVLTGSPGVGKSMLADMLALRYWQDGWQVVVVSSDIGEAWDAYRRDRKQVFIYDDFLGQTDFSERRSKNEGSFIVRFMQRLPAVADKRLIMTTRAQVLRQAQLRDEPIGRGDFHLHECIVQLSDYGIVERARIFYNHLYFSQQSRETIQQFVASSGYWHAVKHPNFTPRIIEQVLKRPVGSATDLAAALDQALSRPIDLWRTTFTTALSETARHIVLLLASFPPEGVRPELLRRCVRCPTPVAFTDALKVLEGTWLHIGARRPNGPVAVSYANPSCRDFILAFLDAEPDYALELIADAVEPSQIRTLLAYAVAMQDGHRKYPSIAAKITATPDVIASRLQEVSVEPVVYIPFDSGSGYAYATRRITALIGLIDPIRILTPQLLPWLIQTCVLAVREHRHRAHFDASDLKGLAEALLTLAMPDVSDDGLADLRLVIETWAESPPNAEDILDFARFAARCEEVLGDRLRLRPFVEETAIENLRNDINDCRSDARDADEALGWLSQLESIAKELGLYSQLESDFDGERQSIYEWEDELREYNPRVSRPANVIGAEQEDVRLTPTLRESEQIDALFKHLS